MKRVATRELSGFALDWAVAKIQKHPWRCPWMLEKDGFDAWVGYEWAWGCLHPSYSTDWAAAGPIIERERIKVAPNLGGTWLGQARHEAHHPLVGGPVLAGWTNQHGPTPLVAAMRCFVASKLGPEIELPEGLQ